MRQSLLAILVTWTFAAAASGERDEFFNSARYLGMGGAGVAISNDETALLMNPAGLGKLRDYYITIADPEIDISEQAQTIAGFGFMDERDPQKALDNANNHADAHFHGRAQAFPSIVVPNFGVGLFAKYEIDAELDSAANKFKYNYTNDWAMVFGFNFRMFDGILKLGANARMINRVEVDRDDIAPNSTNLSIDSIGAEGLGIGTDGGMLLALPIVWLPTLGVAYRDMGRTSFTMREGMFFNTSSRPESVPETIDVGLAVYPILGDRAHSTWTIEYRDVLNKSEPTASMMRRLHGGAEFNFADAFFLRAGMNQGYWTAGMELSIINYQFQIAAYGEDVGPPGTPKEDRRYVMKFAFRF